MEPKKWPLYIATDDPSKSQEEFGPIYRAFSNIFFAENIPKELVHEFRALFPPKSKMKDDMMGILEQLICAQATDFLGTSTSTFSAWISFMRALRTFTFPEVGAVGEGEEQPSSATKEESSSAPKDGTMTLSVESESTKTSSESEAQAEDVETNTDD